MSININVHGTNCIPKPRSFLSNFDYDKRMENERRKRERLEEVRQQSKEIAARIREKVKAEKQKQLKYVENVKKAELKSWKERNVTILQNKFDNCLSNQIGMAHRAAKEVEMENQALKDRKLEKERNIARRSKAAALRQNESKKREEELRKRKLKQNLFGKNKLKSVGSQAPEPELIIYSSEEEEDKSKTSPKQKIGANLNVSDLELSTSTESLPDKYLQKQKRNNAGGIPLRSILITSSDEESAEIRGTSGIQMNILKNSSKYKPDDYRASKLSELRNIQHEKPITAISDYIRNKKSSFDIDPNTNNILLDSNQLRTITLPTSPSKYPRPSIPADKNVNPVQTSPQKTRKSQLGPEKIQKSPPKLLRKPPSRPLNTKTCNPSLNSHPITKKNVPPRRFTENTIKTSKDKENIPNKKSIPSSPAKSVSTAERSSVVPKVHYYDFNTKLNKEYDFPETMVQRNYKTPGERNAIEEAILLEEEIAARCQTANLNDKHQIRGEQALEKELIRKDYEKLTSQLEAFAKEEKLIKSRSLTTTLSNVEQIKRKAEAKQKKMNGAFQNIVKDRVVITCPPVNHNIFKPDVIQMGQNRQRCDFNVADVPIVTHENPLPSNCLHRDINSSDSCTSIILSHGYKNKCTQNTELSDSDEGVKVEKLQGLLQKIQNQKEFLLNEMKPRKTGTCDNTLDQIIDSIENLEQQKNRLIARREENLNKITENTDEREECAEALKQLQKEKEKLIRRENQLYEQQKKTHQLKQQTKSGESLMNKKKMGPIVIETDKKLKKNQFEIQEITSGSSILSNESSSSEVPVKIIIKLSDKMFRKSSMASKTPKRRKSPKYFESIQKSPGKTYPKTPMRKSVTEETIGTNLRKSILKNGIEKEKEKEKHERDLEAQKLELNAKRRQQEIEEKQAMEKKTMKLYAQKKQEEELRQCKLREQQLQQQVDLLKRKNENGSLSSSNASTVYRNPPSEVGSALSKLLEQPKYKTALNKNVTQTQPKDQALNPTLTKYITRLLGMSRHSIDQLGSTTVSEIATPTQSVMDISENRTAESMIYNENKMHDLQRFIEDNHSFLNEINDSLRVVELNGTTDENINKVQDIWMNTLKKKEKEMKKNRVLKLQKKLLDKPLQSKPSVSGQRNSSEKKLENKLSSQKDIAKRLSSQKGPENRLSSQKDLEKRLSSQRDLENRLSLQRDLEKRLSLQNDLEKRISSQKDLQNRLSSQNFEKRLSSQKDLEKRASSQRDLEKSLTAHKNQEKRVSGESCREEFEKIDPAPRISQQRASQNSFANYEPRASPRQSNDTVFNVPEKRKSILKSPKSNIPSTSENIEFMDLNNDNSKEEIIQKYSDLTQNCSQRIAELSEMIKKVRDEKRKIIEYSLSSSEPNQNSTEYMDLPHQQNSANTNSNVSPLSDNNNKSISLKDDQPSDEIRNILQQQSQQIGISKDSGIAMSRPVTASDNRDSPDTRLIQLLSPEKTKTKEYHSESHRISRAPFVSPIKEKGEEELQFENLRHISAQGLLKKLKPPASISRYNLGNSPLNEPTPIHELSTIVEVDTPVQSKMNTTMNETDEERVLKRNESSVIVDEPKQVLNYDNFPEYREYIERHENEVTKFDENFSRRVSNLLDITSVSDNMKFKKFSSPNQELSSLVETTDSSLPSNQEDRSTFKDSSSPLASFPDILAELKRRKIVHESFQMPLEEDLNRLSISSSIDGEEKTTPTVLKTMANPKSPRKKHQSQARVVTPDHEANQVVKAKTPTKNNPYLHDPPRIVRENSNSQSGKNFSGIGILTTSSDNLENDLNEMGLNWAASMLKTNHERAANISSDSTSSSLRNAAKAKSPRKQQHKQNSFVDSNFSGQTAVSQGQEKNLSSSSLDSRPLNLREFINRELLKRTQSEGNSDESSVSQKFLKSLMLLSNPNSSNKTPNQNDKNNHRTSTPVNTKSGSDSSPHGNSLNNTNNLFSGESRISSVRINSDNSDRSRLSPPEVRLRSLKFDKSRDSSA